MRFREQLPTQEMALPLSSALDSPSQKKSQVYGDAQDPEKSKPAVAHKEQNTSFNLKNLPPRQVMSRCLVSFFRGYGLFYFFLPDVHTMSLYRAAYSPEEDELSPVDATPNMGNAEFSLLLLTAAVGALYAEGSDVSIKHIRQELFAVGIHYLDVAIESVATDAGSSGDEHSAAMDESEILTITALATAALYMIFEKEILARKYIGMLNLDAIY